MNSILIIAHAPLASALRECVLHVFPDAASAVAALDVQANTPPEETLAQARLTVQQFATPQFLVMSDLFGATPCNVAAVPPAASSAAWQPVPAAVTACR